MEMMSDIDFQITPGLSDQSFFRSEVPSAVPMTKEEVRAVSICKLHLSSDSIVYDIGGGTGSVSVEIARLSPSIRLYSIESSAEAVALINKNVQKFNLKNVQVVQALAPDGLKNLESPSHAFIGGTRGNLRPILEMLYEKNPQMRVVMNAVSMESICEMQAALKVFPVTNDEIVQLGVSRAKKLGNYHMMQANNPVFVFSFDFIKK